MILFLLYNTDEQTDKEEIAVWIGAMRCCFSRWLLALFGSAWAAGLAQGTDRRNRRETGARFAPERKEGQSAGAGGGRRDKAKEKPLCTALDNLTAYGTNRQQTEGGQA